MTKYIELNGIKRHTPEKMTEEALCALLFNVQGYLHELLKLRKNKVSR
mgnify:CR=1 FL=1